jgi:hypothetical protein
MLFIQMLEKNIGPGESTLEYINAVFQLLGLDTSSIPSTAVSICSIGPDGMQSHFLLEWIS